MVTKECRKLVGIRKLKEENNEESEIKRKRYISCE